MASGAWHRTVTRRFNRTTWPPGDRSGRSGSSWPPLATRRPVSLTPLETDRVYIPLTPGQPSC